MTRTGPFQHVSAGGMSLLVHGAFVAFLLLGVTWRSMPQLPVEAELWNDLPESVVLPEAPPELPPEPLPEPPPQPVKPVPVPPVAQPEVAKPDIALERAEKKKREQDAREQEALRLQAAAEAARAEQDRLAQVEKDRLAREEKERQAQARREQARRDAERRQMEQELARQAQEELAAEENQLRGAQRLQQEKASRQARVVSEFQDRIRNKILGHVRLPPSLSGNPAVEFRVVLLPNGEVLRVTLLRGSGQQAYDQEMERAIYKASPLPLPSEREVAAVFREDLILKFRASDN